MRKDGGWEGMREQGEGEGSKGSKGREERIDDVRERD